MYRCATYMLRLFDQVFEANKIQASSTFFVIRYCVQRDQWCAMALSLANSMSARPNGQSRQMIDKNHQYGTLMLRLDEP